jgi:hypothetical protein
MFGIPLAHDTFELPGVGKFETLLPASARRVTIVAFASAVAITAGSAAGQNPPREEQPRVAATSTVDESTPPATVREILRPGSGSLMVDNPEQCEPGKYWSQWKYTNMDFESIMACKE